MLLLLALFAQAPPGPLDAFRANYASMNAELIYRYFEGYLDGPGGSVWTTNGARFTEIPGSVIEGRWACDGEAEYYHYSSPEEVFEIARGERAKETAVAGKRSIRARYVEEREVLISGDILASHSRDPVRHPNEMDPNWQIVQVWLLAREKATLMDGKGPFHWWASFSFLDVLRDDFSGIVPARRKATRAGYPVEVEIYRRVYSEGGRNHFEVSYDPTIGYLPRFARLVTFTTDDKAFVREFYLVEARACSSGGFVPTEWFTAGFVLENVSSKVPNYDDDTVLKPEGRTGGAHFRAVAFRDRMGPVALSDLKSVNTISAVGGPVAWRSRSSSLTLAGIKAALGTRLTNPSRPALPNIDETELHQFDEVPAGSWWGYGLAALISVALIALFVRRRRSGALLILPIFIAHSGCGPSGEPVLKLNASFTKKYIYQDQSVSEVFMDLAIRNDGNRPIEIRGVDGGCSCRKVDQTTLPAVVTPGRSLILKVGMKPSRATSPQTARIQIATDRGGFEAVVPFFTLLKHQFDPDSISHAALTEDEGWAFDFTHRAIHPDDHPGSGGELVFPKEFTAVKGTTKSGRVGGAPGYSYTDTPYKITLEDREQGLHRAFISLKETGGMVLLEAPIIWNRYPFISSVPNRVILGSRPVRVFLRCPDESIELTRIESSPKGIKAVVSSVRELSVRLEDRAPDVIDGIVEVGTTAKGRPPLRIPVVRYAPIARK